MNGMSVFLCEAHGGKLAWGNCNAIVNGKLCDRKYCKAKNKVTVPDEFGAPGFRCDRHRKDRRVCNAIMPNGEECCSTGKLERITSPDQWGGPGFRCMTHWQECSCNCLILPSGEPAALHPEKVKAFEDKADKTIQVDVCGRTGRTHLKVGDAYGSAGWRCAKHVAFNRCPVVLQDGAVCGKPGDKKYDCEDKWGPAGWRCRAHSERGSCNVILADGSNCTGLGRKRVKLDDAWGKAGWRCNDHGARAPCNITGCTNMSQRLIRDADEHGAAGWRCWDHFERPRCDVKLPDGTSCQEPYRRRIKKADQYGIPGYRCYLHMFSTVSHCTFLVNQNPLICPECPPTDAASSSSAAKGSNPEVGDAASDKNSLIKYSRGKSGNFQVDCLGVCGVLGKVNFVEGDSADAGVGWRCVKHGAKYRCCAHIGDGVTCNKWCSGKVVG